MESIKGQVQALAKDADYATRNQILSSLRDLQDSLESPMDLFMRLYNSVRTPDIPQSTRRGSGKDLRVDFSMRALRFPGQPTGTNYFLQHLQLAITYVGIEAEIFGQLAADDGRSFTAAELAQKPGASSDLFGSAFPTCQPAEN